MDFSTYVASGLSTPCSAQSCGTRSIDADSVEKCVAELAMNEIVHGAVVPDAQAQLCVAPSPERPETGQTMMSAATQSTNDVCADAVVVDVFTSSIAHYADESRPESGLTVCSMGSQSTNECCAAGMVERLMESELMLATNAPDGDVGTELLRQKLLGCMMDAVSTGTLDMHLQAAVQGRPKKGLEELTTFSRPEAEPGSILAKPLSSGAAMLMLAVQSVSSRDRRIGELQVMIREKERANLERDATIAAIQERLFTLNADKAHLDLDVKWHKNAHETAADRSYQLAASQRTLNGDLDIHNMKMRHACIESDPLMFSNNFSTTAGTGFGGTDFSGTRFPANSFMHTPRTALHAVLEPIANR